MSAGGSDVQVGEGFAGSGPDAAHVNTVLGPKDGPVGTAWATALATPRAGHVPFVAVLRPNLPVKPMTLFVNKSAIDDADSTHARLTWGAAQAGVAAGVVDAVRDGVIPADATETLLLITAVWVDPAAKEEETVYENNREATRAALAAGATGRPTAADVLAAGEPANPFFRS
ncbi:MAG: formaldehyde-activating enzyme [Actinomycetota bacterium]